MLKRAIAGLVEMDEYGHNFAGMHLPLPLPLVLATENEPLFPLLAMSLPKIIDITKQIQYAHSATSCELAVLDFQPFYQKVSFVELTLKYI
jgi:hypothetical protein